MKRMSLLTLVFAVLSLVFFILLILLRIPFPTFPLMSVQDVLDLLTPLVLIPIYWLLVRYASADAPGPAEDIAFMVLASLWVLGQGMHLSANSIDNLIEGLARTQTLDVRGTDLFTLTYFFDEYLSHFLWHLGVVGLAALAIYREWRQPSGSSTIWKLAIPAGLLYGFTSFCFFDEGNTVSIGLPFSIAVVGITLIGGLRKLAQGPILAFFFTAYAFTLILLAGWGLAWQGFPPLLDSLPKIMGALGL